MTRLFVVRHGQTEGNQKKIYRGRWDLPLDAAGQQQVRRAGAALKPVGLAAVYTSPLLRARQTAAAVAAGRRMEPIAEEALIDIDYGEWTRMPDAEVSARFPKLHARWKRNPETVVFPGGEGLPSVRARVEPALRRLVEQHPGESIVLASHRVPVKLLLCAALDLPDSAFWRMRIDTASISVLDCIEGRFHLVCSNDTCHLEPLSEKLSAADF